MNVTLKVKHFKYLAYALKGIVSNDSFHILNQIKNNVDVDLSDDTEQTVDITPANIIFVYPILSAKPEGVNASINKDMDETLLPQMQTGVDNNVADWLKVAEFVTQHKQDKAAELASQITEGYNFLNAQ